MNAQTDSLQGEATFTVAPGCHEPVLEQLQGDARQVGLRACTNQDLRLVIEELLTNLVKYSGAAETGAAASIRWSMSAGELQLLIQDAGIPFDPLTADESDLSDEERCEGSMGILLVRALADSIRYSREDGRNCLALSFRAV
jgi:anti-sigma regulatory factor (Ser/Thr protein kinase)